MHLGRRHAPDARDQHHLLSARLGATIIRPPKKTWRIWWRGDQRDTSECVGYSWHGLLRCLPLLQRDPLPSAIYHEAQKVDEWEGVDYEGTSVRAGAKVLKSAGKITAYGWAFDIETVLNWLAVKGPVCLGTVWHDQMFRPDATGRVRPGGLIAGGHAYLAIGYDDTLRRLICQNSWGTTWGIKGRFHLDYDDADQLIRDDGEACTATEGLA